MAGLKGLKNLARYIPFSSPTPQNRSRPPRLLKYRSSTPFIVGTVCMAIFTDIFLYGIIVPVMPFALTEIAGIDPADVQEWNTIMVAVYGIALCLGSPVAGIYADATTARRTPLLMGLVALGGATVLLCLGTSVAVFVVGRVLQGLAAAVAWSVGLALLADTMGRQIGLAMGYVGIALSAGLLCAPLVGGAVYDGAGYYAVYYVSFGLIVLDIGLRLLLVEKKIAYQWLKNEAVASASAPVPEADADADETDAQPAVGTETQTRPQLSAFGRIKILLRSKRLVANLVCWMLTAGVLTAFDTVLPVFTEELFGWSATAAGLLFLTLFTPPLIVSPPVGMLVDRIGSKLLAVTGFAASIPLVVLLRLVDHNAMHEKVLLCVLLSLLGVTLTLAQVPLMAEISFIIETEDRRNPGVWGSKGVYGIGYGMFNTSFALGSSVGSLALGYIQSGRGWSTTTWVLGLWCAVGLLLAAAFVGEFSLQPPPKRQDPNAPAGGVLAVGADEEAAPGVDTADATNATNAESAIAAHTVSSARDLPRAAGT